MNINRRLPFNCKSGTITAILDVVGQIIPDNIDEELIDHVLVTSNQGIVALVMLKMLARLGRTGEAVSAERYHTITEAARLAFAMRDTFLADPDMAKVPVEHILDDKVIATLVSRIDRKRRRDDLGPVPLNIVMKLTECNGQPVAKLSDSPGKTLCKDETFLAYLRQVFHHAA
jgi:hypothetical protein